MANLKDIQQSIKTGLPLRIIKENQEEEQKQKEFKEQYKKELESLGVKTI